MLASRDAFDDSFLIKHKDSCRLMSLLPGLRQVSPLSVMVTWSPSEEDSREAMVRTYVRRTDAKVMRLKMVPSHGEVDCMVRGICSVVTAQNWGTRSHGT
jgi:hypothetical protein